NPHSRAVNYFAIPNPVLPTVVSRSNSVSAPEEDGAIRMKQFPLLLALVLSAAAQTKNTTQTAGDPTATAKLSSAYATFAGTQTPRDVLISGTVVQHLGTDSSGTFTFEATAGGRSKLTLTFAEGTRTEVSSGYGETTVCSWSNNGEVHRTA